ncbi:amidase [Actinophytocola sp.]|uniref:amidase n=1 Tax=Actinophytocola sp. TaxID=1872138 RepID=UPI002ED5D5AF
MTEPHELTAVEQAAAIRARELSPVELARHYLARIDKFDHQIGAFAAVARDAAINAAVDAERAIAEGVDVPPLHGVCTAIKDLNFVAGMPAAFGSAAFPGFVPDFDDNVTTLVRRANMVILGKTTTAELGAACYTETAVAPPARTPWDTTRSAGGSSGGAGAAVATGLVSLAHGSDSAGSVRIPASVCGLVGLKPSRGRISSGPLSGETTGLFANGVLARTVLDAATMLDALAVPMPGDPFALPAEPGFADRARNFRGRLRIARFATPVIPDVVVDGECLEAWEATSRVLEALGHHVEDIPNPFPPDVRAVFRTLFSTGAATIPLEPAQVGALQPFTAWLREQGEQLSAVQLTRAVTAAQQISRRVAVALADYDAVLTPTLAQPPAPVGHFRALATPEEEFDEQARFNPFTPLYNLTGQPAITVPAHWSRDGLPIGVMVAAKQRQEATLLGLAHQLEEELNWHMRRPPTW